MGGQLDGNFPAGSLPHKFTILIVTSFVCLWSIIFFSLSLCSAEVFFYLLLFLTISVRPISTSIYWTDLHQICWA